MKKTIYAILMILALALSFTGCASRGESAPDPAQSDAVYESEGIRLTIPEEMREHIIVKTDEGGMLFTVSEKESVEAQERLRQSGTPDAGSDGAGWLFSIGHVEEARLRERLCGDMSGVEVFARGGDGSAYLYYHPTDVRVVRDGDDPYSAENLAGWTAACEWAVTVPQQLVTDNALIAYTRSNTALDIALSRILYRGESNYELTALSHGTFSPESVDATPYLEALTSVNYVWADSAETPDGEYIVLRFPDEDMRFDFFLGGDGSYVRQVTGDYETLYRAENGADVISPVRDWYDALAAANGNPAFDAAVQTVLDEFIALGEDVYSDYDESAHPELPWYTAILANTTRNNLYYGLYDLDGNGVKELIIACGDDNFKIPEAIYAFDGERMHYLCKEQALGERSHLELAGEYFAVRASGGAANGSTVLYKIAADGYSTELFEIMDYEYQNEIVTYSPKLGNMTAAEYESLPFREFDFPVEYTLLAPMKTAD